MDDHGAALTVAAAPGRPATTRDGGERPWVARWVPWALGLVPVGFVAVFFVWPVAAIIARGLSAGGVRDVLADAELRHIVWFTTWQALLSTALTLGAGLPVAWALARCRFRGRRTVTAIAGVPFVLPTVVVGLAFLALLPERWHASVAAILLAHVFFNVAVVVRTVVPLWERLDPRYGEVASTLGAPRWRVAAEVVGPLLRPAIGAAASVVFLFTFTSFGVVLLLGGPTHVTLEVEIYRRTAQLLDLRTASALALVQLVVVVALAGWWGRSQRVTGGAGDGGGRGVRLVAAEGARTRPTGRRRVALVAVLVELIVLIGVPLAALVERSLRLPDGSHGLAAWRALGSSGAGTSRPVDPLASIGVSLRTAAIAVVLATVVGVLASCAVAYGRRGAPLLDLGLMLPLGTSAVTVGFGLLITMDRAPLDLRGSWVLVPVAHAIVAIPLVVRTVLPVLRSIDPRLREAAMTLGASPARTWAAVDLPLARRAIAVGAGFAFAVSIGEFGATAFLSRSGHETMPVAIVRLLSRPGALNVGMAMAMAVMLLVVTVAVLLVVELAGGAGRARDPLR